ncbi:hypothetical protein ACIRL0_36550 [Streptomyces sp. NPDC102365]
MAHYRSIRSQLATELGVAPGPELRCCADPRTARHGAPVCFP